MNIRFDENFSALKNADADGEKEVDEKTAQFNAARQAQIEALNVVVPRPVKVNRMLFNPLLTLYFRMIERNLLPQTNQICQDSSIIMTTKANKDSKTRRLPENNNVQVSGVEVNGKTSILHEMQEEEAKDTPKQSNATLRPIEINLTLASNLKKAFRLNLDRRRIEVEADEATVDEANTATATNLDNKTPIMYVILVLQMSAEREKLYTPPQYLLILSNTYLKGT